jgi:N-acetylglucosaminyldiphosphoundecaprenol N-acetyl-beta-D-mannosaminyltransferase
VRNQTLKAFCENHYPVLKLVGLYSPPFRALTKEEEVILNINASGAGFVFVALGCPKQEKWMAAMKGRINACMVGIGGALPVMIGMQKRAPVWMQKASLEWLYRLIQEPQRLFKRYAVTNTMFIVLLFTQWLKLKFSKKELALNQ